MSEAIGIFEAGAPATKRRLAAIAGRVEADDARAEDVVRRIVDSVRRRGDRALVEWTRELDGVDVRGRIEIGADEMKSAESSLPAGARRDLRLAARRIRDFHRRQLTRGWTFRDDAGLLLGQRVSPIRAVGVYVPGGLASYPSSVLMNVIPAKVAGVRQVVAVTPPAPSEGSAASVLAAARIAGVDRMFRVGGAQAIAALAHGTATIPAVDKIVGPGNVWVQTAKRQVFGRVGIDNFAGASEVLVIADGSANPDWVAADLLSQAEHDESASAICLTTSGRLASRVARAVARQLEDLPKAATARKSLSRYGGVFVVPSLEAAAELANAIAPEHLELAVRGPRKLAAKIENAGAIFLGQWIPEALGDYLAGPNHVLPTSGTARFGSPLGVEDFVKRTSLIGGSRKAVRAVGPAAARLARLEGLEAHARSVDVRLPKPRRK